MAVATHAPDPRARAAPIVGRAARATGSAAWEYLPAVLLLVGLIVFWEVWVQVFDTKPYVLPAASAIWDSFLDVRGTLPEHIQTTVTEALAGLLIAAVAGAVLAALIAIVPFLRRLLFPIFVVSQNIPMVVLAPLLILWFGFGMTPKIIVVALFGFFPIVVSTVDGLANADREMVGLVRSMGGGRLAVFRHVLVPSALPSFFAGLKIAAAYAVLGAVIGESVGASSGLGLFISRTQASFRLDTVFVAIFVIVLVSIALFGLVTLLARLATPWVYAHDKEKSS